MILQRAAAHQQPGCGAWPVPAADTAYTHSVTFPKHLPQRSHMKQPLTTCMLYSACACFTETSSSMLCTPAVPLVVCPAGALFAVLSSAVNLNHFSNALTVWLGMRPTFLFFQIFLPPLLLDSAVRIDFFLFKKVGAELLHTCTVVVAAASAVPRHCPCHARP